MDENWINIDGDLISLKQTPVLLKELNLMPLLLRRYFEKKYIQDVTPERDAPTIPNATTAQLELLFALKKTSLLSSFPVK